MIELFIDGKPAVLKDNVSIKLTRENVYFTKSGSYTYNVELPLQVKENRDIFGSINRIDTITEYHVFHAVLRVDNKVLLDGKAVINQVTEAAVKVQLLGGNSEMNFYTKGEELYVDELDLGDWMHELSYQAEPVAAEKGTAFNRAVLDWWECVDIRFLNKPESQDPTKAQNAFAWWRDRWWKFEEIPGVKGYDDYDNRGVAFPVINVNSQWNSYCDSGLLCNEIVMRKHGTESGGYGIFFPEYRLSWENQEARSDGTPQVCPSYMPMLCRTIRKVLTAVGYEIDIPGLERLYTDNSLFKRIFIVTANNRVDIAKALPHWTVNEFLTQVERFLGVVFEVDELTKTCTLVNHLTWWTDTPIPIEDIVDEYTSEVSKEDTSDVSIGNIGFSMEDNEYHLSEDILGAATIDNRFTSLAQMQTYLQNGASADDKNKLFNVQGHQFILATIKEANGNVTEYYFKEVNQFGALMRQPDKKDIDVELKIVPATTTLQNVPFVMTTSYTQGGKTYYNEVKLDEVPMPILSIEGPSDVGEKILVRAADTVKTDLESLIEGETTVDSASEIDKMFVAYVPERMTAIYNEDMSCTGEYPVVQPCSAYEVKRNGYGNKHISAQNFLTLQKLQDKETIGNTSFADGTVIDTTVKYCIKFISNEVLKPTRAFLIHGQRFACEKLEYNITAKGVSPLVTGYFYRID